MTLRSDVRTLRSLLEREVSPADVVEFVTGFYQRFPTLKRYAPKVVSKSSGGASSHPEARQHGDEVWLFPKFWALDGQTRHWVFAHELGHYVQGQLAGGTKFLDLAAKHGIDPWDTNALPYGQLNMDEAFADCFAARFLEPVELRRRYPAWAELLDALL